MKQRRSSRIVFLTGFLLFVVALVGFFSAFKSAKDEGTVVVAKTNLPAFRAIASGDIEYRNVPKASIGDHDLTKAEYEKQYLAKVDGKSVQGQEPKVFVPTAQILAGNRVDDRQAAKDPKASFAIISTDERVVAVTTTISGAAVGTIHAGDVVDVTQAGTSGSGTGAAANFAKVLCISDKIDGCKGVREPDISIAADTSKQGSGSDEQPVNVLLAVSDEDATSLAGQTVALALNPFCKVDETGHFAKRDDSPNDCQIDPEEMDREAAQNATSAASTDDAAGADESTKSTESTDTAGQ